MSFIFFVRLQAPKYTGEDLATLSSTCFKLNSLQLRALLQKYQPTPDEPRLPHELIDNVVRVRSTFIITVVMFSTEYKYGNVNLLCYVCY